MKLAHNIRRGSRLGLKNWKRYHYGAGDILFSEEERRCYPIKYNVPPSVMDAAINVAMARRFEDATFLVMPMRVESLPLALPKIVRWGGTLAFNSGNARLMKWIICDWDDEFLVLDLECTDTEFNFQHGSKSVKAQCSREEFRSGFASMCCAAE